MTIIILRGPQEKILAIEMTLGILEHMPSQSIRALRLNSVSLE
jgi:hypothetical protein